MNKYIYIYIERERETKTETERGARDARVIVVENRHGDLSSNPGLRKKACHITLMPLTLCYSLHT